MYESFSVGRRVGVVGVVGIVRALCEFAHVTCSDVLGCSHEKVRSSLPALARSSVVILHIYAYGRSRRAHPSLIECVCIHFLNIAVDVLISPDTFLQGDLVYALGPRRAAAVVKHQVFSAAAAAVARTYGVLLHQRRRLSIQSVDPARTSHAPCMLSSHARTRTPQSHMLSKNSAFFIVLIRSLARFLRSCVASIIPVREI